MKTKWASRKFIVCQEAMIILPILVSKGFITGTQFCIMFALTISGYLLVNAAALKIVDKVADVLDHKEEKPTV